MKLKRSKDPEWANEVWKHHFDKRSFFLQPPGTSKSEYFIRMLPWHRRIIWRLNKRFRKRFK